MPVESPDLNTYLYLQQEALGRMARVIGEADEAETWQQRARAMARRLVQYSWDEESGYFWATRNGKRVNVRTPFNLFPLLDRSAAARDLETAGGASDRRAPILVAISSSQRGHG